MGNQIEIERKYVIKKPNIDSLRRERGYTESRIVQIYLESESGVTHRVRERRYSDSVIYTETRKTRIDYMSSHEEEHEISEAEFLSLSRKIKEGTRPILKTRYTFEYNGVTFEIDVYPDWKETAIMETELDSREKMVEIPSVLEIVKDVTGDSRYSNAAMSRAFPDELI